MFSSSLKVYSAAMELEPAGSIEELQKKMVTIARRAKDLRADILLLPEFFCFDLLSEFSGPKKKDECWGLAAHAASIQGSLQKLAQDLQLAIAGASLPVLERGKLFNEASFFSPSGQSLKQRKMFLTPDELALGFSASQDLQMIEWRGLRFCLLICLDVEIPAVSAGLAGKNIDFILVPSMVNDLSGADRVYLCSAARAVEHTCFVLGASAGSKCQHYQGHAYCIPPQVAPFTGRGFSSLLDAGKESCFELDIETRRKLAANLECVRPGMISVAANVSVSVQLLA